MRDAKARWVRNTQECRDPIGTPARLLTLLYSSFLHLRPVICRTLGYKLLLAINFAIFYNNDEIILESFEYHVSLQKLFLLS